MMRLYRSGHVKHYALQRGQRTGQQRSCTNRLSSFAACKTVLVDVLWQLQLCSIKRKQTGMETNLLVISCNIGCTNLLLQANLNTVVLVVPLPEGCCINLDDGVFDKSLCSHLQSKKAEAFSQCNKPNEPLQEKQTMVCKLLKKRPAHCLMHCTPHPRYVSSLW